MYAIRSYYDTREHNSVSPRLRQPPINGAAEGITISPEFDKMLDIYYDTMGWDTDGKPLPKTLKRLYDLRNIV